MLTSINVKRHKSEVEKSIKMYCILLSKNGFNTRNINNPQLAPDLKQCFHCLVTRDHLPNPPLLNTAAPLNYHCKANINFKHKVRELLGYHRWTSLEVSKGS